jgi:hypothetical protein
MTLDPQPSIERIEDMKKDSTTAKAENKKNKKAGTAAVTQLSNLMADTLLGKVSPRDSARQAKVVGDHALQEIKDANRRQTTEQDQSEVQR